MFEKLEDFYTQDIRIDLNAASRLADLNPENADYREAAARCAFVVAVLQGDIHESVYTPRLERTFDTLAEAKSFFDLLVSEHLDAACFDFIAHPMRTHAAPTRETDLPIEFQD